MIIPHVTNTKNETLVRFLIFPSLYSIYSVPNWPQKLQTQICISTQLLIIDVKGGKKLCTLEMRLLGLTLGSLLTYKVGLGFPTLGRSRYRD